MQATPSNRNLHFFLKSKRKILTHTLKTPTAPPPLVFFLRLRKKVVPLHHKTQKSRL